ncbi:hypothetical protein ASD19_12645 [Microbacterium sp. Root53]|nr:hypothetical protein ASD19_12645 [Microbacterium sp. Root53]
MFASASEGAAVAARVGASTLDRATEAFRAVDLDGDGVPDRPRAAVAAEEARAALKGAAAGVAGALGTLFTRRESVVPETTEDETRQ